MGHIKLVVPVVHIWFFKSLPNKIGYLVGISSKKLETIVYYERYVVINPGVKENEGSKYLDLLTEEEYFDIIDTLPKDNQLLEDNHPDKFVAKMGAEAIRDLLVRLNLDQLSYALRHQAATETSQQRKSEALKRLRIVEAFREGQTHTEDKPEDKHETKTPIRGSILTRSSAANCCKASRTGVRETLNLSASDLSSKGVPGLNFPSSISVCKSERILEAKFMLTSKICGFALLFHKNLY